MTEQEQQDLVDDLLEMSGMIYTLDEMAAELRHLRPRLNKLYEETGEIVWVGFGFNDGDDMFTVNIEVK